MTMTYLLFSLLAALGFYLSSPHQHLWADARLHVRGLRIGALASTSLATAAAVTAMGFWAGLFAVLTALMTGLPLLPYLDAWRQRRGASRHVG